jgi:hypothetical protein
VLHVQLRLQGRLRKKQQQRKEPLSHAPSLRSLQGMRSQTLDQ